MMWKICSIAYFICLTFRCDLFVRAPYREFSRGACGFPGKKGVFLGRGCLWSTSKKLFSNLKNSNFSHGKAAVSFRSFSQKFQWQPSKDVFRKRCSENMQQIYRRIFMPKCDFNKVVKQLYWIHTLAWVFSSKFAAYFQNMDSCFSEHG